MCVTMPGQVLDVQGGGALVEVDGRARRVSTTLYPGIGRGEWVMVAAGTIVDRLSAREARRIRSALRALTGPPDDRRDG